jgi:hypothetical protein
MVLRKTGKGVLKGADMHALVVHGQPTAAPSVTVAGVAEVKSGRKSADAMCRQLDQHILRTMHGVRVAGVAYPAAQISLGCGPKKNILRITVQPSDWRLPRTFRFENTERGRLLRVDETETPHEDDQVTNLRDDRWHITLKSSKEAIAQAAYEMTFWYMEKVGEIIYSDPDAMPKDWLEMTPAEAGRNAAKMMLYYAILRCRTASENQRAIALYNTYGFGYALGMSFRNAEGRREMLWPQDLDEILRSGKTKHGCRIEKFYSSRIESHPEESKPLLEFSVDAWTRVIRSLSRHPEELLAMAPRAFEELVAELLAREGMDVTLTPPSRDGGKDILAVARTPVGKQLYLVECKRYAQGNPVGVAVVRSLYGVVMEENASSGLIVTTSRFTSGALNFAEPVQYRMGLVDFQSLLGWLKKHVE